MRIQLLPVLIAAVAALEAAAAKADNPGRRKWIGDMRGILDK